MMLGRLIFGNLDSVFQFSEDLFAQRVCVFQDEQIVQTDTDG